MNSLRPISKGKLLYSIQSKIYRANIVGVLERFVSGFVSGDVFIINLSPVFGDIVVKCSKWDIEDYNTPNLSPDLQSRALDSAFDWSRSRQYCPVLPVIKRYKMGFNSCVGPNV